MAPPTPLEKAPDFLFPGRAVLWKREDEHDLGAFKWRGALPAVEGYRARGALGVVTASTGNHGAATAWAAKRIGLAAVVFAPTSASSAKLDLIERHGAEIHLSGRDLDESKVEAVAFAARRGLPFFEDGAEPAQYAGYGAIAEEILEQCREKPAAIVVPVGNGALIGGIGETVRRRAPEVSVVGVAAKKAPVMALSFEAGRAVACGRMATFADGLAVRVAIPYAVEVMRRVVNRMLLVSEREIARAMSRCAAFDFRFEGAAAAALAALPRVEVEGPVVVVITGRNIDEETYQRAVRNPDSFPD